MAKKSRRARRGKHRQRKPPAAVKTAQQTARPRPQRPASPRAAAATVKSTAPATATASKTVDFREEYSYVYADLKRIAIIAAALLAVLIVLSLVIK